MREKLNLLLYHSGSILSLLLIEWGFFYLTIFLRFFELPDYVHPNAFSYIFMVDALVLLPASLIRTLRSNHRITYLLICALIPFAVCYLFAFATLFPTDVESELALKIGNFYSIWTGILGLISGIIMLRCDKMLLPRYRKYFG